MHIVEWKGKPFIFAEDLNHIYLTDIEESMKHKREVVCAYPKSSQSTVDCFDQLKFLVEASLGNLISKGVQV